MSEILASDSDLASIEPRIDLHDGYVAILLKVMENRKVKIRTLQKLGVISERTRRQFDEKMAEGRLSISDTLKISDHLKIDPVRAMVAVMLLRNPMAYFEPYCTTLATYAEELSRSMQEQVAAASGDFEPIRRNLVRAHTTKITREVFEHQKRSVVFSQQAFQ